MSERQHVSYNTFCLRRRELMSDPAALPSAFEVVVVGTGLEESVVAAAAARTGHSVLHLDVDDFYGGAWASFTLDGLREWARKQREGHPEKSSPVDSGAELIKEGERLVRLESRSPFSNVREEWHVEEAEAVREETQVGAEVSDKKDGKSSNATDIAKEEGQSEPEVSSEKDGKSCDVDTSDASAQTEASPAAGDEWTRERLTAQSRRFNLDLAPRLLFSRGAMVELLIASNVARYTEFKSVTRILAATDGDGGGKSLVPVPSSRSDVFATKRLSVLEKRLLMKFLSKCAAMTDEEEGREADVDGARTFGDYLAAERLTPGLVHFVACSLAMRSESVGVSEGLRATRKFLDSLGRFGNSPFLWSMYGAGELPQAFCRLCAVFGGTYFLGRAVEGVVVGAGGRVAAVVSGGARIDCQKLVLPASLFPAELAAAAPRPSGVLRRQIRLNRRSMLPDEREQLSFVSLPDVDGGSRGGAHVVEVGAGGGVCPGGVTCVHVTSDGADVSETVAELCAASGPLWSLSFDVDTYEVAAPSEEATVFCCAGPRFELDYDAALASAAAVFAAMFPGEEFLPRAPDPEEIIIGGEDEEEDERKAEVDGVENQGETERKEAGETKCGEDQGEAENTEDDKEKDVEKTVSDDQTFDNTDPIVSENNEAKE